MSNYNGTLRTHYGPININISYRELEDRLRLNFVKLFKEFISNDPIYYWLSILAAEIIEYNPEFVAEFEEYRGGPMSGDREKIALLLAITEVGEINATRG